jgi:hypothetical protein
MQVASSFSFPPRCSLRFLSGLLTFTPAIAAQSSIYTIVGSGPSDRFGEALAVVGDVDGDGADDIAVNSWSGLDSVRVHSGATQALLYTVSNGMQDQFGRSIAAVGDIDGDGRADFLVGANASSTAHSGASGAVLHTLPAAGWHDVGGGGDATGDGVNDLLVGSDNELRLYDGATGLLVRSHPSPDGAGANFGRSPTFLGDVNGDSLDDYAAGAPGSLFAFLASRVFAFDGATGSTLWHSSAGSTDQLGWSLQAFVDVDQDGAPDLLAGAKQDPGIGCGGCNGKGFLRMLDGATGATLWQTDGVGFFAGLGFDLALVADLDGDGIADCAASQPGSESGCETSSSPVLLLSSATGATLGSIPGGESSFGYSLAGGDANGDGWGDLLVGVPCEPPSATPVGFLEAFTIEEPVATYCTAKINSQGCTPAMSWTGLASLAASTFRANAAQIINQKNGILFWGRQPAAIPFLGGTLCVGGTITRTGVQTSGGNPPPDDCSGTYSFQFTSAYMLSEAIQPGELIHCQYWYRDPAATPGSGLSDGLEFLVLP